MSLIRAGAIAAMIGGVCWVIKGAAILLTGDQPPLVFEVGPPLFAVALLALATTVGTTGRAARVGGALAYMAVASWVLGVVLFAAGIEAREDSFSAANAVVLFGFLSTIGALILLGTVAGRSSVWPSPWRWLPLAMGVAIIPMMAMGAALAWVNERLLEIPIVFYGIAWVALGSMLWRHLVAESS